MQVFSKTVSILSITLFALLGSSAGFTQTLTPTITANDAAYQAFGGKEGIKNVVDAFLPIVLADPRIKDKFKDADVERLGFLLTEQFCDLLGGPCQYSGKSMRKTHADKDITNAGFNALAEDLQIAMDKQGIPSSLQNKLIAKLAPMQSSIVTK